MKFPPLVAGQLIRRDNRFRATVCVAGDTVAVHVANSGRLLELFAPGRPAWLTPATKPGRKTDYDLTLVDVDGTLVSADARLPNRLFHEWLEGELLEDFRCSDIRPEMRFGESRLDFCLTVPGGLCWVEVKSVTLVEDGRAYFPDAPTGRGRRHVCELIAARETGERAVVVFVVQRPDAHCLLPHPVADPEFETALREADAAGVELRAYTCRVSLEEIVLGERIPVVLPT